MLIHAFIHIIFNNVLDKLNEIEKHDLFKRVLDIEIIDSFLLKNKVLFYV